MQKLNLEIINKLKNNTGFVDFLIEKDYYLDIILYYISQDQILSDLLIFKGGTCLSKGYLNYFRLSEDLDWSVNYKSKYIPEEYSLYNESSKNKKRKIRSNISNIIIEAFIDLYNQYLKKFGIYSFEIEKCNSDLDCLKKKLKHNESKFLKIAFYYPSILSNQLEQIYIEIMLDTISFFEPEKIKINSLFNMFDIVLNSYSIKQIFVEKFCALTDRGYHERRIAIRDYYDIYYLISTLNINVEELIPYISERYIQDFLFKKGSEGFIENRCIMDLYYDKDIIINEIFNQENLLHTSSEKKKDFLNQNNLDFAFENIYIPIQYSAKEYLGIAPEEHMTDGLYRILKEEGKV